MKNIIRNSLIILASFSTAAYAATEAEGGGGFLWALFIGFFALIVVFQLIPAVMLFTGLLKGLFVRESKSEKHLS